MLSTREGHSTGDAGSVTRGRTEVLKGQGGAQLVQVDTNDDDGLRLAYSTSYRLDLAGRTIAFTTVALPAAYLGRSWTFTSSVTPAARAAWTLATSTLSPLATHVLDEIGFGNRELRLLAQFEIVGAVFARLGELGQAVIVTMLRRYVVT